MNCVCQQQNFVYNTTNFLEAMLVNQYMSNKSISPDFANNLFTVFNIFMFPGSMDSSPALVAVSFMMRNYISTLVRNYIYKALHFKAPHSGILTPVASQPDLLCEVLDFFLINLFHYPQIILFFHL